MRVMAHFVAESSAFAWCSLGARRADARDTNLAACSELRGHASSGGEGGALMRISGTSILP